MIKTNIVILNDLDQKKSLFEIIFKEQIYSNKLDEYIRINLFLKNNFK